MISLDADLQDDVDAIEKMVDNFIAGDDIVYGVRSSRKKDTFFKRFTAEGFYKFMAAMGVEIVFNHADYRLMSRRALDALSEFDEVNLFLRGIVPQIGFRTSTVEYERKERLAGESKYPLKKMLSFAFEGITSFSVRPLKIATTLGIFSLLRVPCNAYLLHRQQGDRSCRRGLGEHRRIRVGARRTSAVHARHYRRVCRQDIHGDQASPEIYNRVNYYRPRKA